MGQFFFAPDPLEIAAGTTVTWSNDDAIPHTVTSGTQPSGDGQWDSGVLTSGQSFSRSFAQPGTFQYFCLIHPTQMSGTIVVTP